MRETVSRRTVTTNLKAHCEEDTAAWSENQAAPLRSAAQGGSNQELDRENLAEEIESILEDSPSRKKEIPATISREMRRGIEYAADGLTEFDELARLRLPSLRKAAYTPDETLGDGFPAEPRP